MYKTSCLHTNALSGFIRLESYLIALSYYFLFLYLFISICIWSVSLADWINK